MMSTANDIVSDIAKQTEDYILEQLNEFVSRGLIILEKGPMTLVHDEFSSKIKVQQQCRLILKDQEYIVKLETENKRMKEILKSITDLQTEEDEWKRI